jgi:superfamily II DNA or RNA helicase
MEGITIVDRPSEEKERPSKKQRCTKKLSMGLPKLLGFVELRGTYDIPLSSFPAGMKWKEQLWFKKLTVKPQLPKIGGVVAEPFPVYTLTEDTLSVPKFLGMKWFGMSARDNRTLGSPVEFGFTGSLQTTSKRPQRLAHDQCVKQLKELGGAMLVLPCGFGKTVVSLAIASSLQRKTLVIVAAVELARQWVERVKEFVGCEVGFIQGDTIDIDKPIVVAMLQTLLRRQPDLSMFGTCLVDEAHHVAARAFSRVMPLIPCRYILGLSATPERKDGLKRLLHWTLGPVAFEAKRDDGEGPSVMRCVVTEGAKRVLTYKNGDVARSRMITWLSLDKSRNAFIIHMVNSVLTKNSQRKVLMLTDRRDQVSWLQLNITRWTCGLMLGGMKESDIEVAKENQILLSTYQYCAEGFDMPCLDTLFLLTPRTDVEQSVGRVLRQHPTKQKPVVLDFVDNFSCFQSQADKREKYFKKLGCMIKTYTQLELTQ